MSEKVKVLVKDPRLSEIIKRCNVIISETPRSNGLALEADEIIITRKVADQDLGLASLPKTLAEKTWAKGLGLTILEGDIHFESNPEPQIRIKKHERPNQVRVRKETAALIEDAAEKYNMTKTEVIHEAVFAFLHKDD